MITHKLATLLAPLLLATTTVALTPQEGAFPVGVGEQRLTTYLEAPYVPSEVVNETQEQAVIHAFGLNSTMYHIARCESGFRPFDASGEVLRGLVNPLDRGIYQINEKYWLEESIKQNYDIRTIDGNISMAQFIMDTQGVNAWSASSKCWSK